MYYTDGYELDENYRVLKCARCGNEEFSEDAFYCRICGTALFNYCHGTCNQHHNEYSNDHKNDGNARFCEICGEPTYFYTEKLLPDWEEIKAESKNNEEDTNKEIASTFENEESDIPF